jgi:hypothetical protein
VEKLDYIVDRLDTLYEQMAPDLKEPDLKEKE